MSAQVRIDFRIGGVDAAARAFTSVSQAAERAIRRSVATERSAGRERTTEHRRVAAEEQRLAREVVSVVRQANREKLTEERKVLRDATVARRQAATEEKRQVRETATEEKRQAREVVAVVRDANREKAREVREAGRIAQEERRREEAVARQRRRTLVGVVGGAVSGGAEGVRTLGRGAGAVIRGGAGVAGSLLQGAGIQAGLAHAMQGRIELEKRAVDLSNSGYQEKGKGIQTQRVDPKALMQEAQKVGGEMAIDPTKAMEGMQKFTGVTGDMATARAVLGDMAKLARATGASLDDVLATAGEMSKSMGDAATSEGEARNKAKQIFEVMKVQAGQGKLGSVELEHSAKHGGRLASAASQFEGDVGENVMKVGMLAQEARGGGGAWNAATAFGAVSGLVNTFKTKARADKFKAEGIELMGEGGKLRDPTKIISEAIDKTGGNIQKLQPMFANVVGARAMQGLANKYLEGSGGKTDDESKAAGRAKVQEEIDRMTKGAAMSDKEVNDSSAKSMNTMEAKAQLFQQRIDKIAGDLADKLIPAFLLLTPTIEKAVPVLSQFVDDMTKHGPAVAKAMDSLVPAFGQLASVLSKLIGMAVENPALAGGAVVGGMAAKGALVAGGSAALAYAKNAFVTGGAGALVPTAVSGAAGKVAGVARSGVGLLGRAAPMLGAAGGVAAAGAAGVGLGMWATGKLEEGQKGRQRLIGESMGLNTKVRSGEATDAERQRASELVAQLTTASKSSKLDAFVTSDQSVENAGKAAQQLQEALTTTPLKLDPNSTVQLAQGTTLNVVVTNASEIAAAGNAQRPKIQVPGSD